MCQCVNIAFFGCGPSKHFYQTTMRTLERHLELSYMQTRLSRSNVLGLVSKKTISLASSTYSSMNTEANGLSYPYEYKP